MCQPEQEAQKLVVELILKWEMWRLDTPLHCQSQYQITALPHGLRPLTTRPPDCSGLYDAAEPPQHQLTQQNYLTHATRHCLQGGNLGINGFKGESKPAVKRGRVSVWGNKTQRVGSGDYCSLGAAWQLTGCQIGNWHWKPSRRWWETGRNIVSKFGLQRNLSEGRKLIQYQEFRLGSAFWCKYQWEKLGKDGWDWTQQQ